MKDSRPLNIWHDNEFGGGRGEWVVVWGDNEFGGGGGVGGGVG